MLINENGIVYCSNFAFALPEGVNLPERISSRDLEFTVEKWVKITIKFQKGNKTARQFLQGILNANKNLTKKTDIFGIVRCGGVASAVFYEDKRHGTQHYEEIFEFAKNENGETLLDISISVQIGEKTGFNSIYEAMRSPAVKEFCDYITYF